MNKLIYFRRKSSNFLLPPTHWFNSSSKQPIFEEYSLQFLHCNHDDFSGYIFSSISNCFHSTSISHPEGTYINIIHPADTRKKADPILTRMICFNEFQTFQINKINFEQYLKLHNHPDTFTQKSDATTQTDYTTIRPNPFLKNLPNRIRTPLELKDLVQYWPSDDNDSNDDELQKDPLKYL